MPRFDLLLAYPDGREAWAVYDSEESRVWVEGEELQLRRDVDEPEPPAHSDYRFYHMNGERPVSPDHPGAKRRGGVRVVKLNIGMACNYRCAYCLQDHAHTDPIGGRPSDVGPLVSGLKAWVSDGDGLGVRFEIRGGEPFVYWKTLKPLVEGVRRVYPQSTITVTTNGSLLDMDKARWLVEQDAVLVFSHDGPGQMLRGADPLDDPKVAEAALWLHNRSKERKQEGQSHFLFASMINRFNTSRLAILDYFTRFTGDDALIIGEGGYIDISSPEFFYMTLAGQEAIDYRINMLRELQQGVEERVPILHRRLHEFHKSFVKGVPDSTIGQRCGLDSPDRVAIDIKGNVLTCQNHTIRDTTEDGRPHHLGHVSRIENVKLDTATHWSHRDECRVCPVIHLCRGSCMALEGDCWKATCENAYSDSVPLFARWFEVMTGAVPTYIHHPVLPEDRQDIFGLHGGALPKGVTVPAGQAARAAPIQWMPRLGKTDRRVA
jgi:uncharacterized protein